MRKVLSFVLVLALVLGSFSMAFAADTTTAKSMSDIEGIANEQAILVNYNLGIVEGNPDGTFLPEKAVTRAEFAAMITRALNIPDSALAGYTASGFKDTAGAGWAVKYLAFCESKGIMLGDGAGNAMPGKTINTNEAVTMALRAVGYTANSSKLVGVWPSNYVSLAQSEGLYKNVVTSADGVDKANAAQIIYNLLTVEMVQVSSDGTTVTILNTTASGNNDAATLLVANHDATKTKEVVEYESSSLIKSIDYLGQYADVYRNDDGDVIAVGDIHSTTLTGTVEEDSKKDGLYILTDSDDVEYTLDVTKTAQYSPDKETKSLTNADDVYKGFSNAEREDDVLDDVADGKKNVSVNVDLTNKNAKVWYSTVFWNVKDDAMVASDDIDDLKDGELLGQDFTTNKNDEIIDNSFTLVGVKSLSDIKADNVVYVYASEKDKEIRKIAVGTETAEGTVTKKTGDINENKVTIDGKVYEFAENNNESLNDACNEEDFDAGDSVKVFLDANGDIYDYELVSGGANDFAVVIDYDEDSKFGQTEEIILQIQMITADGSSKVYDVDEDVLEELVEDGVAGAKTDIEKSVDYMGIATGEIIKYGLNKSGEIDSVVTTSYSSLKNVDELLEGKGSVLEGDKNNEKELKSGGYYAGYEVKGNAVFFTASLNESNDLTTAKGDYGVTTFDKLKGIDIEAKFVLDKNGRIDAFLVNDSSGANDVYGVVIEEGTGVNADNDKVDTITALVDGEEVEYIVDGKADFQVNEALYKFEFNADGEVTGYADKIELTAENALTTDFDDIDDGIHEESTALEITSGAIVSRDGNIIVINGERTTISSEAVYYVYDEDDDEFQAKAIKDVTKALDEMKDKDLRTLLFFVSDTDDTSVADIVVLYETTTPTPTPTEDDTEDDTPVE